MLTYEVTVDGDHVARAGITDWAVMSAIVGMVRDDTSDNVDYRLSISGMTRDREDLAHHVRWRMPTITVGSEIVIKIVESDQPDAPTKRFRADREVQENPFTEDEVREMRYQSYLELKAEFEGNPKP